MIKVGSSLKYERIEIRPNNSTGNKKKPNEAKPSTLIWRNVVAMIKPRIITDKIAKKIKELPNEKEIIANISKSKKLTAFP